MKFSLLQTVPEPVTPACEVLYDLSLDRAAAGLIPDPRRRECFLSVLSSPLTVIENIRYRQDIFRDFCECPGLFEDLQTVCTRYDKIRADWQEMRLGAVPAGSANPEAMLEHTFASLKITAVFPGTIVSYYGSLCDTLSRYPLRSAGLIGIRDYCATMRENDSLRELTEIAAQFRYHEPSHYTFTLRAEVDRTLRLFQCGITDLKEADAKASGLSLGALFRKKDKNAPPEYDLAALFDVSEDKKRRHEPILDDLSYEDGLYMQNQALSGIDTALTRVTGDIYEVFYGLSRELLFYEAGLSYRQAALDAGIPCILPELLPMEEDTLEAKTLRDVLLLSGGADAAHIVPNDVRLTGEHRGMLIKGLTDSGKTVCLRSLGAAQLLAQAGLPILAESGRMSIRSGFFSHFSSAEEEFLTGDAAGRFDGEAKEVSAILDRLTPHSLVFFNETFQTTSYGEGTEGMAGILRILPRLKTQYVFVTHLTRLFDVMKNDHVLLASTSEDPSKKYKIEAIPHNSHFRCYQGR